MRDAHFRRTAGCPGIRRSGQRSCRCQCSVLLTATRARRAARGDRPAAANRARARPVRGRQRSSPRATPPGRRRARRCRRLARHTPSSATRHQRAVNARSRSPCSIGTAPTSPDMPAVLDRPHALAPRPRAHPTTRRALRARRTVCSPSSSPDVADTAAIVCERLWVSAPSTIIDLVHLHLDSGSTPGGHGLLGRCHAPIKSRQDIRDRRRATQRKAVRPDGRQPESESARRRSRTFTCVGRHRRSESKQQAWIR